MTAKYRSLVDSHIVDIEVYRMYKPENVEVKKVEKREEGIEVEDEVTEIKDGTLGSFIKDWETYNKNGNSKKDDPVIYVCCSTGARKIVKLTPDGKYHPKSTMGSWMKTYKKAPFVGQKVKSVTNENGFFEIVLRS